MSTAPGFRYKVDHSPITIDQVSQLIGKVERSLAELKEMIANDLSPSGAELVLFGIFNEVEYEAAVMTNDQDALASFQAIDE